jgi:transposase
MSETNEIIIMVGVDVAKDKLDIEPVLTIKNEASAFKKLLKNRAVESLCVVMEATGGYEKPLVSFLLTENIKVAVVNAKRVRDFANAMGAYAKNDRIDAHMIRYYAETAYPKGRLPLREPRSEVKVARLLTVNGIGIVNAMTLMSLLPELGNVSNKEIATLVGVAPYSKDSGKKTGKRTIFGGRALIRSTLYMAILSAKRHNKPINTFCQRLIASDKPLKVAFTACMRKLLVTLNSIVKHQSTWNPDFAPLA